LLMASSGLASAEIRNLKYKDFIKALEHELKDLTGDERFDLTKIQSRLQDKDVVGQWHVIRQKTEMDYITFSTPESIFAIIEYLKNNENNNKYLKSMEDYLFSVNGNKMKGNTFDEAFQAINDRCGFGKSGYQRFFRSHNLRKFFTNALYDAGMDSYRVEWLLGHKLEKTAGSYFKMDIESMRKEYMKHMDALIIIENNLNRNNQYMAEKEKVELIESLLSNNQFIKALQKKVVVE
ncbi:MAG: tyrosine-type recombinase/integrase, partial [Clostridiaceae bacterium]